MKKQFIALLTLAVLAFTACQPNEQAVQSLLREGYSETPSEGYGWLFKTAPDSAGVVKCVYFIPADVDNAHSFKVPSSAFELDKEPKFLNEGTVGSLNFCGYVEGRKITEKYWGK